MTWRFNDAAAANAINSCILVCVAPLCVYAPSVSEEWPRRLKANNDGEGEEEERAKIKKQAASSGGDRVAEAYGAKTTCAVSVRSYRNAAIMTHTSSPGQKRCAKNQWRNSLIILRTTRRKHTCHKRYTYRRNAHGEASARTATGGSASRQQRRHAAAAVTWRHHAAARRCTPATLAKLRATLRQACPCS